MGSTQFGNFGDFCRDSFLPICNILTAQPNQPPGNPYIGIDGGCVLYGIHLSNNRYLANLGSILVAGIAIVTTFILLWRSNRKLAAVGRREMQIFLLGYLVIAICEIFTVGAFPINDDVRRGFTAVQLGAIATTGWWLFLNALIGYQLLDDGTLLSIGLMLGSGAAIFIGTGYIALDTAFGFTDYWADSYNAPNHRNIALYVLYQGLPLLGAFLYFVLETYLVLRVLREFKPMIYLVGAALLFAIGQIFMYVISIHICRPSNGKINGTFFETLFTYLSVVMIWIFWSSITEDDWPVI